MIFPIIYEKNIQSLNSIADPESQPPGQWIMTEMRLREFLSLSIYPLVGISCLPWRLDFLSTLETDERDIDGNLHILKLMRSSDIFTIILYENVFI